MAARPEPSPTYSLGAVCRMTGLTPATLRAWERRHDAVRPERTDGGTRRYRDHDVTRLRLLKAAVDGGHRISDVVGLSDDALSERGRRRLEPNAPPLERAIAAIEQLDVREAESILSFQLAALGPLRFAREFALPMLTLVGEGWQERRLCIASEHLGSALLRSFLGTALRPFDAPHDAPRIVFATTEGERHELGLLTAAIAAVSAGARPIFLGADLPAEEVVLAAGMADVDAVALSFVHAAPKQMRHVLLQLREDLPTRVELWVGGPAAQAMDPPAGIAVLRSLEAIEERVLLLRARNR